MSHFGWLARHVDLAKADLRGSMRETAFSINLLVGRAVAVCHQRRFFRQYAEVFGGRKR
jgi:hypothetical protein